MKLLSILAITVPSVLAAKSNFALVSNGSPLEVHPISRNNASYYVAQISASKPATDAEKVWSINDAGELTIKSEKGEILTGDFTQEGSDKGGIITFTPDGTASGKFSVINDALYYDEEQAWFACSHGKYAPKLAVFPNPKDASSNCNAIVPTVVE